jgi:glycosyltransferase involved in cell wall biosynthesis
MHITVILCTYQRCERLAKALQSVAGSAMPESTQWEVLIVDNNSTDNTRNVSEEFCRRYSGRFRYIFELRAGKSYALNSGIQAARGDILAFMDDDVLVEPTWLHNLTRPILSGDCVGSGGRILPQTNFTRPKWVGEGRYALAPLALFDLGLNAGRLEEAPFGTNMAFRRTMFERYGRFRTDLGPCPINQIRSEDTEFGARLLAGGEILRYEPTALVFHPAPPDRLRKEYFLTWWFDKGRGDIREHGVPPTALSCFGVPLFMIRRLVIWSIRWALSFDSARRFDCKVKVWGKLGEILECCRSRRSTVVAEQVLG